MNAESTRKHYDSVVESPRDARRCLANRAKGPAIDLKKFHNQIKRELIKAFCRSGSLLDIACGRGGDLSKWNGLNYIRGIDISSAEIDEARRRHVESFPHLACEFDVCDSFGTETYTSTRIYDSITCMFAIQYFVETETMLDTFMHNVSSNLKRGGCFVGTVPCGQRIHDAISKSNMFVDLVAMYETPQPFGSAYTCNIKDTVTAKTNVSDGAIEYLVFEDSLIASAEKFGLVPFRSQIPANLVDLFETPTNARCVFKYFKPMYASTTHADLGNVSRLFAAFAFMKI
jgi:mRNA (guanine-N7-)-methyltransferase